MIIGKAITAGGSGGVSIDEILPSGFEQIEYIKATGTQYIDTSYAFSDNFSWEITFDDITAKDTTVFGGRTSAERTALLYYGNASNNNGVAYICCPIAGMNGKDTPFKLLTADPSEKHTVKMAVVNNTASVWLDGEKKYDNATFEGSYISGVSQVIFADNYGTDGIKEQTSAKVYSLKMWQGKSLVRNFVPCRNDLGEVGLYDLVNARFYGNNGSGNFVAGKRTVTLKGNGIGCVLTVETAEGALVKAALGSKEISVTAGADGIAILVLEKEGLWTVSATLDGETKSTEILVEHNVEERLIFAMTFYIIHNNVQYDYKFLENWTWADFVASEFNDGNFIIDGTNIKFFDCKVQLNETDVTASTLLQEANYSVLPATYVYKAGWTALQNATVDSGAGYCLFKSDYLKIGSDSSSSTSGKLVVLEADFTDYKKLYITARTTSTGSETGFTCVGWDNNAGFYYENYVDLSTAVSTSTWDIASVKGTNYIHLRYHKGGSGGLEIYDIHFE